MKKITINSRKSLNDFLQFIVELFEKEKYLTLDIKAGRQRTLSQNGSLHLWARMLSEQLNDQGLTFEQFFKSGFEMRWTPEIVKDNIWRPVQIAITGKKSTRQPDKDQYPEIYEVINKKLSSYGIHVPWPTKEDQKNVEG